MIADYLKTQNAIVYGPYPDGTMDTEFDYDEFEISVRIRT